ncbi:hypothetical protein RvVAR031_13290 [Agrobacterium vitis]|nr:hypothetical protein RvVAR031_13290 [Agrobacterium vitis]
MPINREKGTTHAALAASPHPFGKIGEEKKEKAAAFMASSPQRGSAGRAETRGSAPVSPLSVAEAR